MTWSWVIGDSSSPVTSGSVTIPTPTGTAAGDLYVVNIAYRDTAAFTAPAGWTIIRQESTGNLDENLTTSIASGLMAYHVRGASEPGFVFTRSGGGVAVGDIEVYRSSNSGTITLAIGVSTTLSTAASSGATAPGLTTAGPDRLLVGFIASARANGCTNWRCATDPSTTSGSSSASTAAPSSAWVERWDTASSVGTDVGLAVFDAVKGTAGATGDMIVNAGLSARHAMFMAAFVEPAGDVSATVTGESMTLAVTDVTVDVPGDPFGLVTGQSLTLSSGSVTIDNGAVPTVVTVTGKEIAVTGTPYFFGGVRHGTSSRFLPSQWASLTGGNPQFGCLYTGRTWHAAAGDNRTTTTASLNPRPYAITSPDNNRIRFEVRPGDIHEYAGVGFSDPSTSERSELGGDSGASGDGRVLPGNVITWACEIYIASGTSFNAPWSSLVQFHGIVGSPIIELGFRNAFGADRLILSRRTGSGGSPNNFDTDVLGSAFPRDRWVPIVIRTNFVNSAAGYLRMWVDGVQRYNFNGAIGYTNQEYTYLRFGIYRRAIAQTWVVEFQNVIFDTGTLNASMWVPPSDTATVYAGDVVVNTNSTPTLPQPISVDVTGEGMTASVGTAEGIPDTTFVFVEILGADPTLQVTSDVGSVTVNTTESFPVTVTVTGEGMLLDRGIVEVFGFDNTLDALIDVDGLELTAGLGDGVVVVEFIAGATADVTGVELSFGESRVLVWSTNTPSTSSSWIEIIP